MKKLLTAIAFIALTFPTLVVAEDFQFFPPEDGHGECTGNNEVKVLTFKAHDSKTKCMNAEAFIAQYLIREGCTPGKLITLSATNPNAISCK